MTAIEIFRAGTRRDANGNLISISRQDLETVVANYSAEYHEAPIVIGHPKHDTPAFGWVEGLSLEGDVLTANIKQVDSQFAELVREGKYKKISSAFYLPRSASNPKPEGFYLRHVGFLGAMPPAVKGLADPIFNDNQNDVVEFSDWAQANLWQRLRDFFISQFGLENADKVLPAWQVQGLYEEAVREELAPIQPTEPDLSFNETPHELSTDLPPEPHLQGETMSPEDKAKMEALEAENAQLKAQQAQQAKAQAEVENAAFAESLVAEGKLIPRLKDSALALLNAEHGSAEFSENDFKNQLKQFLTELPKAVEFAEIATKQKANEAAEDVVEYAEGTNPASIEADQRVRDYMQQHQVDYTTAFKRIYN